MASNTYNLAAIGSTPGERKTVYVSAAVEEVAVAAYGTFGGGNVTIEFSFDDGTTWIASDTLGAQADAFSGTIKAHAGMLYRATLAGGTGPYDIDVTFFS